MARSSESFLHTLTYYTMRLWWTAGIDLSPSSGPTGLIHRSHSITGARTLVLQSYEVNNLQQHPNQATFALFDIPVPIPPTCAPLCASAKYNTHGGGNHGLRYVAGAAAQQWEADLRDGRGTTACWTNACEERGATSADDKSRRVRSKSKSNPAEDMVRDFFLLIIYPDLIIKTASLSLLWILLSPPKWTTGGVRTRTHCSGGRD